MENQPVEAGVLAERRQAVLGRLFTQLVDAQAVWSRPLGDANDRWLRALLRPLGPVKDLLHGRWLGHPLHAAVTDIPIGALAVTVVLDLADQRPAADIALLVSWHGSRFELANGHVRRGPAVYDQPAYEVRVAEAGGYEVRRVIH